MIQVNINKPIKYDCEGGLFYETKMSALTGGKQVAIFKKSSDELWISNCNRLGGNYINPEGTYIQMVP